MNTLAAIATDPSASESARVSACIALLDRGFGKPIAMTAEVTPEGDQVRKPQFSENEVARRIAFALHKAVKAKKKEEAARLANNPPQPPPRP